MTLRKKGIDTDSELRVARHKNGIELLKPDQKIENKSLYQDTGCDVGNLFKLPMSVYFMNAESNLEDLNEETILICGYSSREDSIGKNVHEVTKKEIAESIINNDREVMGKKSLRIIEENFYRKKDEKIFSVISIKLPWYQDHQIVGVFGLTIPIALEKNYPLSDSLERIAKMGLLSTSSDVNDSQKIVPGLTIGNTYITKREWDCLALLVYGKTAKQIARILNISSRTVECYLNNVKNKLNVSCKADLIEKVLPYFFNTNHHL